MNPNAEGGIAGAASSAARATMMAHGQVRTTSAAKSSAGPLQGATKEMEMKAASTPVNPAGGSGCLKFGRSDPASESLPPAKLSQGEPSPSELGQVGCIVYKRRSIAYSIGVIVGIKEDHGEYY